MKKNRMRYHGLAVVISLLFVQFAYSQTAATHVLSGVVYNDFNHDTVQAANDFGQVGVTLKVYGDNNLNNRLDTNDALIGYAYSSTHGEFQFVNQSIGRENTYFVSIDKSSLPINKQDVQPYVSLSFQDSFEVQNFQMWLSPNGICTGGADNIIYSDHSLVAPETLMGEFDSIGYSLNGASRFTVDLSDKLPANTSVNIRVQKATSNKLKLKVSASSDNITYTSPSSISILSGGYQEYSVSVPEATRYITIENTSEYGVDVDGIEYACPMTALPVDMLYFDAKEEEENVRLDWATSSESFNNYFSVQRRYSISDSFAVIGHIAGQGSTKEMSSYSFLDEGVDPFVSTIYYRLVQVDFDGQEHLTETKVVTRELDLAVRLVPNPAKGSVQLDFNTSKLSGLRILDMSGRDVTSFLDVKEVDGSVVVDIRPLRKGTYVVQLRSGDSVQSKKLLVLHK